MPSWFGNMILKIRGVAAKFELVLLLFFSNSTLNRQSVQLSVLGNRRIPMIWVNFLESTAHTTRYKCPVQAHRVKHRQKRNSAQW